MVNKPIEMVAVRDNFSITEIKGVWKSVLSGKDVMYFTIAASIDSALSLVSGVSRNPATIENGTLVVTEKNGQKTEYQMLTNNRLSRRGDKVQFEKVAGLPQTINEETGDLIYENTVVSIMDLPLDQYGEWFENAGGPITIEFTFLTNEVSGMLFESGNGFQLGFDETGIRLYKPDVNMDPIPFERGTRHHFAIVSNGVTLTAYLNGQQVGKSQGGHRPLTIHSTAALNIGYTEHGQGFRGELGNLRIWNCDQTHTQIGELAQGQPLSGIQHVNKLAHMNWQHCYDPVGLWINKNKQILEIHANGAQVSVEFRDSVDLQQKQYRWISPNHYQHENSQFSVSADSLNIDGVEYERYVDEEFPGYFFIQANAYSYTNSNGGNDGKEIKINPELQRMLQAGPNTISKGQSLVLAKPDGSSSQLFQLLPSKRNNLYAIRNVATGRILRMLPPVYKELGGTIFLEQDRMPALSSQFGDQPIPPDIEVNWESDQLFRFLQTNDGSYYIQPWMSVSGESLDNNLSGSIADVLMADLTRLGDMNLPFNMRQADLFVISRKTDNPEKWESSVRRRS